MVNFNRSTRMWNIIRWEVSSIKLHKPLWTQTMWAPGTPGAPKIGRGRKDPWLEPLKGAQHWGTLTTDGWSPAWERTGFCCLEPPCVVVCHHCLRKLMQLVGSSLLWSKASLPLEAAPCTYAVCSNHEVLAELGSPSGHWHFGAGGQTPPHDQPPAGCQVSSELPWGDGVAVTVRALPFVTGGRDTQTPSSGERHDGWVNSSGPLPAVHPHCALRPLSAVSTPTGAEPWSLPAGPGMRWPCRPHPFLLVY